MRNNEEKKQPTADSVAEEFTGGRRSLVWGKGPGHTPGTDRQLLELPLDRVDPDPNQPRRYFDARGLEELKQSIKARGQFTPAFVRPHPGADGRYMLIAGERRYRVLKDLSQETILAFVLPVSEQEAREIALIDNLQRADLSAFEEAAGYQELMDTYGYTQEQVAQTVGKDQTVVSNTLAINKLPENIKKDDLAQQASKSVLLELARVTDTKQQRSLWTGIKRDIKAGIPISVRKVRERRTAGVIGETAPTPPIADKVIVAGKHFEKQLAVLTAEDLLASPEHQSTLRAIKERLDRLLAEIPEVSPTLESAGEAEAQAQ